MKYKKKCFIGPAFDSLDILLAWIDSDFWVFIHSRPYHPSFVRNRMLGMVREEQRNGIIRACLQEDESPYVTRAAITDSTELENILACSALNHQFSEDATAGDLCVCGQTVYTEFDRIWMA